MDRDILKQAIDRLQAAKKKAAALRYSRSLDEIAETWSEFLTAHVRFLTRLGHAMDTPHERSWFDVQSAAWKNHDVLRYTIQARNSDEHGRDLITNRSQPRVSVGRIDPATIERLKSSGGNGSTVSQTVGRIDSLTSDRGKIRVSGWEGEPNKPLTVKFSPAAVQASAVTNRGVKYLPPPHANVADLAVEVIAYLDDLIKRLPDH